MEEVARADAVKAAARAAPRWLAWLRLAAVLAVLALFAIAHHYGVFGRLSEPARVAGALVDLGGWGYLAFIVAYALFQPFGVPGTVFVMAAPLIWPWPVAFALSMTGTMAASVVGFSFARFIAREWIAARMPARFKKYDDALAARAFTTVFLLRLVFWMPSPLHAFFGISRVGFWKHFWGSLAGYALPLLLVSFFGRRLFDALSAAPLGVWIILAASGAAILLAVWRYSRSLRAARQAPR